MLKVLYLPIGNQSGTVNAFRQAGVDLSVYDFAAAGKRSVQNTNTTFLSMVKAQKPDLIHMQLQMTNIITVETMNKVRQAVPKAVITNWTGDIRRLPSPYFISISKVVDYSLLSHIGQMRSYEEAGCKNPRYWQIGYNPDMYFPKNNNKFRYAVAFTANVYRNSIFPDSRLRFNIADRLKKEFGDEAGVFGGGYPGYWHIKSVSMEDTNDLYNNSNCVLSVSNFNDVSHYFSDRLLYCLASGRPTIAYRFPGYQSYFADKNDILIARNADHIIELIKSCINDPKMANRVGTNGFRKAYSEHTFLSRIIELLSMTNLIHKV